MRTRRWIAVGWLASLVGSLAAAPGAAWAQDKPAASRAARWLAKDSVEPLADLVNQAALGETPKFVDRLGKFSITTEDRALSIRGNFPEATVWRFDLTTLDHAFDMRKLYAKIGNCAFPDPNAIWTRKIGQFLGDPKKGLTHTGPWEILGGKWLVPTARVALDGKHVYTSWFDQPNQDDLSAGRVYASFGLDIPSSGEHTIRVSFDDFVYGTAWRMPRWDNDTKPPITTSPNDLRPHHIGSVAIGVDERVRSLEPVSLRAELRAVHPRLVVGGQAVAGPKLTLADIEPMLIHVDTDRGERWEYSVDEESMASENDMDAGKNGFQAAMSYDQSVTRLTPDAKAEWDRLYLQRFNKLYTFFVFQRNYHPTGYAQNHCSATVLGLLSAAMVWDGPEAEKWLRWSVMTCRKRIELLGKDGGVEWMNEGRDYGMAYFLRPLELIQHGTGLDLTQNEPFFINEWRYALHNAPAFPATPDRRPELISMDGGMRTRTNPNVPLPPEVTPENTPTDYHFPDVDQVYMRSDWSDAGWRARLWAGSVFGKEGGKIAKRFNWAHCRVNQGSFVLSQGKYDLVVEAGQTRTYRKSAGNNNCILVNDTDQWGGGFVWHPGLEPERIARIDHFADGPLLCTARTDLACAYPPEARLKAISRVLVHVKPALFLLFDRVETDGPGKAEWRFHTPYPEPTTPSDRFTLHSFDYISPALSWQGKDTLEKAFPRHDDVRCQAALLTPGVKASVALSDVYYRWTFYSMPQRHLKIVQEGPGPLVLLTAFGPQVPAGGQADHGTLALGDAQCVYVVGPGTYQGLESDGYFALAVERGAHSEVYRFGGSRLVWKGVEVASRAPDVQATIDGGKIARRVETMP